MINGVDPWRYICPDCGSHDLTDRSRGKDSSRLATERRVVLCGKCRRNIPEVHDKKTGHNVAVASL